MPALVLAGVLAGCSAHTLPAPGRGSEEPVSTAAADPSASAPDPAATTSGPAPSSSNADLSSPQRVVTAFVERVSRGETRQACELLDQPLQDALGAEGGCPAALGGPSVTKEAKQLARARVHEDKIEVDGDTATVEDGAVTVDGKAVTLPVFRLVRHDDRWWIALPA